MKIVRTALVVAATLLGFSLSEASAKGGEEHWIAFSETALAITGNIILSPTQLRMAGQALPLRIAADLRRFETELGSLPVRVMAVTRPRTARLLRGNSFGCGEPIRWIVLSQFEGGKKLEMDTFSGKRMPGSIHDGGFCGSYFYERPRKDHHSASAADRTP